MARQESDREDLIREAVALIRRVELRWPGSEDLVTAGFRSTGALSLFLGQDPVYQFDPEGRLRRAFAGGFLFRSQQQTLARLQRVRTAQETCLQRQDLGPEDLANFRSGMLNHLREILIQLTRNNVSVVRQVPESPDLRPEVQKKLEMIISRDEWLSPTVGSR